MARPVVAIVGRPNVGKSTLFNRLIGEQRAVMHDVPGTTRDRLYGTTDWRGHEMTVVDTGGIGVATDLLRGPGDPSRWGTLPLSQILDQAQEAMDEADVIVFLVDSLNGISSADQDVANLLRRSRKPIVLGANKAEGKKGSQNAVELYELGLGDPIPFSAIHGTGTGDLLDAVVDQLGDSPIEEEDEPDLSIAIVGRPNVGKSSLLNRLLGKERAIVSPIPGTTRDAVDTELKWHGKRVRLIDTAGIRRRGRIENGVEKFSVLRAVRAIERAEIAILVIDAEDGVTAQDTHVAGAHLEASLASGADVRAILARLAPAYPEYARLQEALEEFRRRQAAGDRPSLPPEGEALRLWQSRHGLDTTGRADSATRAAREVPAEKRIGQLRRALEFWRWLPRDLGSRHLRVNIADFRLGAYEGDREVLSRRVVLGSVRDRTPVFSDRMSALVLNPSWNVPASIAMKEILPELRKDPGYLARHDMDLLAEGSDAAAIPPPDSIDWSGISSEAFPYRIRQRPGPANPLGRIKFVLTNPMHIYLHDTPGRDLFRRSARAFSHGCVRVENPLELAAWAMGDSAWTADAFEREIGKAEERQLPIGGGGIPVHILYWTTFIDTAGGLNFRSDVYGWDRLLERLLDAPAASGSGR